MVDYAGRSVEHENARARRRERSCRFGGGKGRGGNETRDPAERAAIGAEPARTRSHHLGYRVAATVTVVARQTITQFSRSAGSRTVTIHADVSHVREPVQKKKKKNNVINL